VFFREKENGIRWKISCLSHTPALTLAKEYLEVWRGKEE
jgi:hypothetical protein